MSTTPATPDPTQPNPAVAATATAETPAKKPREPKAPPAPPVPIQAQPTPLADRQIGEKKVQKLTDVINACVADFDALKNATAAAKGVCILAGKGALPQDVPEGFQAVSLPLDIVKGRRVSGTMFSTRLKNVLIEKYRPMQVGAWLEFPK